MRTKAQSLTLSSDLLGQRLDKLLCQLYPDYSRAFLQKAIKAGACQIDRQIFTDPAQKISSGQELTLELVDNPSEIQAEAGDLEILWQDADLLVCHKPAGLTVHPCPSQKQDTFLQRLLSHFPEIREQGGMRPGIVHRLDKETSGLIIVAKNEWIRQALVKAFADRTVHKTYLALVSLELVNGKLTTKSGLIDLPLARDPQTKVKVAVVPENHGGKKAQSHWQCLWHNNDFALLAVQPTTGRTHQIRVHLASANLPILGDKLYASKRIRDLAPRHLLHAWKIAFTHPRTGEHLHFTCQVPEDFWQVAENLNSPMQKLIITGSPGSGKSSVAKVFSNEGYKCFNADQEVHKLYLANGKITQYLQKYGTNLFLTAPDLQITTQNKSRKNSVEQNLAQNITQNLEAEQNLEQNLEEQIFNTDHSINRQWLLHYLEAHPSWREQFENLVHNCIYETLEQFFLATKEQGEWLAVAEIPLWFENQTKAKFKLKKIVDSANILVLNITCNKEQRLARLKAKGWSEAKIVALDSWQLDQEQKKELADLNLNNDQTLAEIPEKVQNILEHLINLRIKQKQATRKQLETILENYQPLKI